MKTNPKDESAAIACEVVFQEISAYLDDYQSYAGSLRETCFTLGGRKSRRALADCDDHDSIIILGRRDLENLRERLDIARNRPWGPFDPSLVFDAAMLLAELAHSRSGLMSYARAGKKSLVGAMKSHSQYHEATEESKRIQKQVRAAYMELQQKLDSEGRTMTDAACHMRLASKFSRSESAIKKYLRGLKKAGPATG